MRRSAAAAAAAAALPLIAYLYSLHTLEHWHSVDSSRFVVVALQPAALISKSSTSSIISLSVRVPFFFFPFLLPLLYFTLRVCVCVCGTIWSTIASPRS